MQDGARTRCDIILDLRGDAPLFPAPEKREGYLRADPGDPLAVARLALEAVQLTGTFEKPLYVKLEESLCAHSRAGQVACTNCLDICPTGAISPAGDHIAIDPMVCAGCGACAALCPSTAITYSDPPVRHLLQRLEVLARTFRAAGGRDPRLLLHDSHGAEMIRLAARFGDGLPSDVIPLELSTISGVGHAETLAALAHGFSSVSLLPGPATERDALTRELALAEALGAAGKVNLLEIEDPDALSPALATQPVHKALDQPVLPLGNRRQIARLAAQALADAPEAPLPLPDGAPYGAVLVDTDACTLCLSCVSLCPSGALVDNPDLPQLRFQEDACLQCGLCATICPENAIALQPQLDLSDAALSQRVLNEEEPFACSDQARMIQMCDDCRVQAQFHSTDNPFTGAEPPRPRTTDDYYSKRRDH